MALLSAKEAAIQLGIDARTFRKFMRATTPEDEQPGQGNRWQVDTKDIKKLKKRFADWSRPKVKASTNGQKPAPPADEVEEFDDSEGPTDEDLEAIELEVD